MYSKALKLLWEVIHTKFDNPMKNYMALMQAARKAKGKHKQKKHNNSHASKLSVVSDVPMAPEEDNNPYPEAPTWDPWAKWAEVQQQLMATVIGTQSAPK